MKRTLFWMGDAFPGAVATLEPQASLAASLVAGLELVPFLEVIQGAMGAEGAGIQEETCGARWAGHLGVPLGVPLGVQGSSWGCGMGREGEDGTPLALAGEARTQRAKAGQSLRSQGPLCAGSLEGLGEGVCILAGPGLGGSCDRGLAPGRHSLTSEI